MNDRELTEAVREHAQPLIGLAANHDYLIGLIGDPRLVLLGEASHGTHDFYHERAEITQRLIEEQGFTALAVEADWPDAYRVNRYVRGIGDDAFAVEALSDCKRFPQWMWRNTAVAEFVEWLRQHNDHLPGARALFVLRPLRRRHAGVRLPGRERCDEVLRRTGGSAASGAAAARKGIRGAQPKVSEDEVFYAEQNALLVKNAEAYYRSMFLRGAEPSWNLRDRHMMDVAGASNLFAETKALDQVATLAREWLLCYLVPATQEA